ERGDAKARAEFAELLHGGKALAGDVGERGFRWNEEIGVSALAGTADAAAELVKFSEAEAISAVDEDGVGGGNVQAVLDGGGGEEDVGFVVNKFEHRAFELFFAQDRKSTRL